jgi:hypothetical protein
LSLGSIARSAFRQRHEFFKGRIRQVPEYAEAQRLNAEDGLKWLDEELANRRYVAGDRNTVSAGINKSFADEANAFLPNDGRGDTLTPGSSLFIINRDPFRAVRRGRQLFQRKFTREQGHGPRVNNDSTGDLSRGLVFEKLAFQRPLN